MRALALTFALVVLGAATLLYSPSLLAEQTSESGNFVYVMTNKKPDNSVIQYLRGANGALTWVREVATGGSGTGPNGADPLGSQDSLVLSGDGHVLLAANAGSNEVSVLGVTNGKLMWRSKTQSGGDFPNSIALSGDLVYVLNSKGATPNITGFRLDVNGGLHWVATVALPAGSMGPNDIRFAPDGSELLVTLSASNQILAFPLAANGVAGAPVVQMSAGMSPFGIRFGHNEVALISEAGGSLSSYQLVGADMLDTISGAVPDTQMATCWISVPRDGKHAFVSNTASGTLSAYGVAPDGELTLLNAVAADPGGTPIDSSLSDDGRFLYVENSVAGKILLFRVDGGSLVAMGSVTAVPGLQGIAAQW